MRRSHPGSIYSFRRTLFYDDVPTHNCQCGSLSRCHFHKICLVSTRVLPFCRFPQSCRVRFSMLCTVAAYFRLNSAFCAVSCLMAVSALLQLSLLSAREWASLFGRVDRWKMRAVRSFSLSPGLSPGLDARVKSLDGPNRTHSLPGKLMQSRLEAATIATLQVNYTASQREIRLTGSCTVGVSLIAGTCGKILHRTT
jgi:hypothetical protein